MEVYLSAVDHKILELLYHYGLAWQKDIEASLALSNSHIHERLQHLLNEGYVQRRKLSGGRRTETYALTNSGFLYMKEGYGFPHQYIENYDLRFEQLTDGFIKHECLVTHSAARFKEVETENRSTVYDRRSFLSHIPQKAKEARSANNILQMEIQSARMEGSHRADDILYIESPGERTTVLLIEVDRGTESAKDRHGRPRGKVSKMFYFYIDAYRENFYRRYFGSEVKPRVLFIITTAWSGSTRKQNFIDLWEEVGKGYADQLPVFTTLGEFDQLNPFTLIKN